MTQKRRIVVLAEGKFDLLKSKTANQAIRYIPEEVVAVIDGTQAGRTAQDVLGFGGAIPVLPDLGAALAMRPDTLLIGIAPTGGRLPESWRGMILEAIDAGLEIISGLHTLLGDDPVFAARASARGARLTDLRKIPPEYEVVAGGHWRGRQAKTVLTVGTDCNVGKMTASLELHREFLRRGLASDFVPTGQTGILLAGKGIAIDSIISDYVAGAIEKEVDNAVRAGSGFIHVEGQGSLTHQGYSAVTLGLMHGVMPDAMVMVHHPARRADDYGFPLDDVRELIALHEAVLAPFKCSKVTGIALNTAGMTPAQARAAQVELERELGLPVADVLTPEVAVLADALLAALQQPAPAAY